MSGPDRQPFACHTGGCVRVGPAPGGGYIVWSTRRPWNKTLIDADEWDAFIAGAKAGEFDRPEDGRA